MDLDPTMARQKLHIPAKLSYPSPATQPISFPSKPYVTHCRTPAGTSTVVVATDDGALSLVDKPRSTMVSRTDWSAGGKATGLDTFANGNWATSGSAGIVSIWDARTLWTPSATLPNPRGNAYLSVAAQKHNGFLVAAGGELQAGEAAVDIFDLRQPSAPLFSYTESHSDDVTALSFHSDSKLEHILMSGSSDGLAALYDLSIGANEDDAVVAVGNTGASLAKLGWGGAPAGIGRLFVKPDEDEDKLDGLEEDHRKPRRGFGGVWTVSDMQTVGIWDADRFDAVLEPVDAKQPNSTEPDWETDYIIDAFESFRTGIDGLSEGVLLFTGDQSGGTSLIHVPSPSSPGQKAPWTLLGLLPGGGSAPGYGNGPPAFQGQGHTDIVRCVDIDPSTHSLTTGGEDGKLCIWSLESSLVEPGVVAQGQQVPLASPPSTAQASGANRMPSRGGSKWGRGSGRPREIGSQSRFKPYG